MSEVYTEDGAENKTDFEKVFDLVKAEFIDDDTLGFTLKESEGRSYLRITFQTERGVPYAEQSRVVDVNIRLDKIFVDNGIVVDDMISGPCSREYRLAKENT